ncbi:MSC_0619 family F1-like ATPase alpha subunit [[Mycoplasma] testudinis]|uniref:MSC_0619 family F1-like ATPase alpha subunit n=1 Tax=[Mycoplasma] testudinis TaxID=33924 RepID=UPI000483E58A|nr:ATP F0F1 synthase subunit alpha [[Mycoplasma] testudinis]
MQNKVIIKAILDNIVEVQGNYSFHEGQFFYLKDKPQINAYLITATEKGAYLLIDNKSDNLKIGDELIENSQLKFVRSSHKFFGNIIDVYGNVILPKPSTVTYDVPYVADLWSKPVNMLARQELNTQLYTGILGIDLFTPIGLGQRQLILGDRKTGKSHIALNMIINQIKRNVKCIYVSIGQKRENLASVYDLLKKHGALSNTIIIEASATSAYQQFLAPYVAMAHAENFSYEDDVLVVFDDLTQHAHVYRELSLLIDKPIGKEAFPGDVFYLHSKLLEKSGKFIGRKSITCIPIVKTINNDVTGLISTNIISITDGQIVTDTDLFAQGKLPAINFNLSVSRTGNSVQNQTTKTIAGEISKIYLAYKKQIRLANLDYELNKETSELIHKGREIEKMLNQKGLAGYSERFLLLMAKLITWGILRYVSDSEKAKKFITTLIDQDPVAEAIFKMVVSGENFDNVLMKNYFASALNQYFTAAKIDNYIPLDIEFIKFTTAEMNTIIKKMENA